LNQSRGTVVASVLERLMMGSSPILSPSGQGTQDTSPLDCLIPGTRLVPVPGILGLGG